MPQGTLEVCYDERGHEYKIPPYCFTTPANVTTARPSGIDKLDLPKKTIIGKPLMVKVRINPGDHNLVIECDTSNSLGELKRMIYEASVKV
jgi:hypothetical protein